MNSSNPLNFYGADIWRRTYWFFMYEGRMLRQVAANADHGSLSKVSVGRRSWAP
jgi:hypothetical protein